MLQFDLHFSLLSNHLAVVLCPLSVTDSWVSEIVKFTPKLEVLRYVGDKEHRCTLRKTVCEHVEEKSSSSEVSFLLSCYMVYKIRTVMFEIWPSCLF